jgi:RNA polymerase sigma factor (sigma-70 family)
MRSDRLPGWYDFDEMLSAAYFGLVLAAARNDESRNTWSSYAKSACHTQISSDRRVTHFFGHRRPISRTREPLTEDFVGSNPAPLETLIVAEDADRLRAAMAVLPALLREIIERHRFEETRETLAVIGASLGCTPNGALKREQRAMAILRKTLGG